jgi:hypothetical protein
VIAQVVIGLAAGGVTVPPELEQVVGAAQSGHSAQMSLMSWVW